jgi:hypothetical protein
MEKRRPPEFFPPMWSPVMVLVLLASLGVIVAVLP